MGVRLFALDVDGVLTDGSLYYTAQGEELKAFHVHDGLGLKLLQQLGVEIAVISGRTSAPLEKRLDDLGIKRRALKCGNKIEALNAMCADLGIGLKDVAYMGDDLIDLEAMEASGFSLAPANAVDSVRIVADHVTSREGGKGAVREACEHLAFKMGHNLEALARKTVKVLVQ